MNDKIQRVIPLGGQWVWHLHNSVRHVIFWTRQSSSLERNKSLIIPIPDITHLLNICLEIMAIKWSVNTTLSYMFASMTQLYV